MTPVKPPIATAPRQVTGPTGIQRWACRVCGQTSSTRAAAERHCTDDPAADGGELILPGHRTHEQVLAQLETRMAELEQEAARRKAAPPSPYPCAQCKWSEGRDNWLCAQPLVKGFDNRAITAIDWDIAHGHAPRLWSAALCGREKALWEPLAAAAVNLTRWQHLLKALFG